MLHQPPLGQSPCLAAPVTELANEHQGLLVAGGGGWVVSGQHVQEAQLVEGASLARPAVDIAVERERPGQGCGGGRIVPRLPLQYTQLAERVGRAKPVASLAGCRQGAVVKGGGLIPVTAGGQEAAYRGRYRD